MDKLLELFEGALDNRTSRSTLDTVTREFPTETPTQCGNWKVYMEDGTVILRVSGFPHDGGFEDLWVRVTSGDDLSGDGVVCSIPDHAKAFKWPCCVAYDHGNEEYCPVVVSTW